jgi:hypothetical protein
MVAVILTIIVIIICIIAFLTIDDAYDTFK